ncbi:MAG: hypothetical protein ACREBW_04050 [Candidatus Micrarchaeaceae archaeon]
MDLSLLTGQLATLGVTSVTFVLSLVLAITMTMKSRKSRQPSQMFWALGLWIFAITVLIEMAFAAGAYSGIAEKAYLALVALLVEVLALGSIQLVRSRVLRFSYYAFFAVSAGYLFYATATSSVGNLISNYMMTSLPPLSVTIASILVTVPSTAVLIAVAAIGFVRTRKKRMLSIIAGIALVAAAGSLYIAQFPSALYIAEFVGILLLWIGFT